MTHDFDAAFHEGHSRIGPTACKRFFWLVFKMYYSKYAPSWLKRQALLKPCTVSKYIHMF